MVMGKEEGEGKGEKNKLGDKVGKWKKIEGGKKTRRTKQRRMEE